MRSGSTISAIGMLLVASCSNSGIQPRVAGPNPSGMVARQEQVLFLHHLAPPVQPNRAQRIVSARIYPGQSFSVSVGETDDPFSNHLDGAWTNAKINKNGVAEPRAIEPIWNSHDAVLAGRVDRVHGAFYARLQGRNRTTLNYFHDEIELEKPVYEQGGLYWSNAICGVWFVLSANSDCSQFLKQLDDGTLHLPVVSQDSPAAKAWKGRAPNGTLQILDAEPDDGPNATPSHR
jgi:hypothetical protein